MISELNKKFGEEANDIIVYYEKNNKGDYNMSKVKQWAEDTAEKSVDLIIEKVKDGQIDLDTAKTDILNVENVSMTGINADIRIDW